MRPCTRRIVPAEGTIKATSLNDALGEHAPWCRTAPNALPIHIKPLAERDRERDEQPGRDPRGQRIARLAGADEDHEEPLLPRCGEATELPHREIGAAVCSRRAFGRDRVLVVRDCRCVDESPPYSAAATGSDPEVQLDCLCRRRDDARRHGLLVDL